MKKVLLLIISLFFAKAAFAYQTVIVDFPPNQGWHSAYYATRSDEAILQYVPVGQSAQNWTKTIVFHSYKDMDPSEVSASRFMDTSTAQMERQNSSQMYKYLKYSDEDAIAARCIEKNQNTPRQCEIYRASYSYEGLITMHYINKDTRDFWNTYDLWYQIVKDIRIYYSYYRTDRILDKATIFEL